MFYKMAFIDLDGTLLSLFDRISLSNLKSLKKYKYLGGQIVLCTGRWPISACKINTILENYNDKTNKYLVCLNGALIYDLVSKKTIRKEFIESSICEKILNIRKDFRVRSFIYSETGIQNKIIHSFRTPFKKLIGYFNSGGKITNFVESNSENLAIYKILFFSISPKKISKAYNALLESDFGKNIQNSRTSKHSIEVTALNVSKGFALELISKLAKIPKSEIATFGDSGNDISMFKESGISFAINSKNENLLNIATHSIKEKSGVSYAIENYLLNDIVNFKDSNENIILDLSYLNLTILNDNINACKNIFKFFLLNGKFILVSSEPAVEAIHSLENFLNNSKLILCNNSCSLYSVKDKKYLSAKLFSETRMNVIINILNKEMEQNKQVIFVFYVTKHTHYVVGNTYMDYELFLQNNNLNREFYEFIKLDELLSKYITSICQVRVFNYKYKIDSTNGLIIRTNDNFIDINPSLGFSRNSKDIFKIMKFYGNIINAFDDTVKKTNNKKEPEILYLKELDKFIAKSILA